MHVSPSGRGNWPGGNQVWGDAFDFFGAGVAFLPGREGARPARRHSREQLRDDGLDPARKALPTNLTARLILPGGLCQLWRTRATCARRLASISCPRPPSPSPHSCRASPTSRAHSAQASESSIPTHAVPSTPHSPTSSPFSPPLIPSVFLLRFSAVAPARLIVARLRCIMAWMRGRLLGAGAFGSVNLAIKREDGAVFAVKSVVVREGTEVAVRAIENEIRMLQELESRYVVRCLGSDWSEEGTQLMRNVFLEYMPEGCLTDFVKQFGSLDEHLLRTYTRSIVEGIDYLHRKGIVHCDVKGKNILVGNGMVKLTDFGSAKRVGEEVVNCAAMAQVNGTPLWMAPEVVRQVEQGPPSDIWSLGCTVVEMATGRAPWSNLAGMNHFVALYHIGCTDELPAVPASLSEEAHDFLSHCFERDPRRRWTSTQLLQHPFLTSRFVPVTLKAPASPISVMDFPASDSDSDMSAADSFVNSVPTLAAPSLFKRGLVSALAPKVQVPVEENWWSTRGSPDSGPWIVVRSPKSASSPPSFALSDWTTPASDSPASSAEAPIAASLDETFDADFEAPSEIFVGQTPVAAPVLDVSSSLFEASTEDAVLGASDADISSALFQFAAGFDFCHFAIPEMYSSVALLSLQERIIEAGHYARFLKTWEGFLVSVESEPDEAPSASLNVGFAALICTINEYSELVYQYSNPQILLYWWRSHRKRLHCSARDSEKYWKCIIHLLDEYTLLLILEKKTSESSLAFISVRIIM